MIMSLLNLFSIPSTLLLFAFSQSVSWAGAQAPQRDNRPRTASISGRVTISGKPAVNAVIIVAETNLKPYASGSEMPIPHQTKTRTDGDGHYLVGGLAEGRYVVSSMLKAFIPPGGLYDSGLGRTVTLDEGEARENIDFTLIRGGVMTGRVTDDEGAPLIAKRAQLYTVDEHGQKRNYEGHSTYEMFETDDRGVYRIYGLPPGRYIISAGGEGGKFATTWHPDATDEKQARIIEIKEGSEVTDVDIRFGSARKTYQAEGRVIDRDTGKPVPGVYVSCRSIPGQDKSISEGSATAIAGGQGNFKLPGLPPGNYQAVVMDVMGDAGYTSEAAEFEITSDNVSGVELKAFLGAIVSGFVVIDGADSTARDQLQSITIFPSVTPLSDETVDANGRVSVPGFTAPARVSADGGFVLKGLRAGGVSFMLVNLSGALRIKRIERDGVEVKEAIQVRPGEKITGVRIVAYRPQGLIRGQIQIVGGALPDGWRLGVQANRPAAAGELKSDPRMFASIESTGGSAVVDEKGRFVIDGLPAGEYDLSITLSKRNGDGSQQSVSSPESNQRVTVRENVETPVTITFDLGRINRPQQQEERQ
ncbi:MAG: carboxypeptidase regulatory-like domain-containing protein [Chloracidobacterium sp.]|nr:carboxypeptidase regulatory-like domain-containing protein [Chloracidobacterium sp.]